MIFSNRSILNGNRRHELRDAALLGAGAMLAGGALWWALGRASSSPRRAPGWPGIEPHWSPGSKEAVGKAVSPGWTAGGRVWFTLRQGSVTEVFYPRADLPAIRDLESDRRRW